MTAPLRLLRASVLRYVLIFWAFYEVLIVLHLTIQPRFAVPAQGFWNILLYCAIDGSFNVLMTLVTFAFLDVLAGTLAGRRWLELPLLGLYLVAVGVVMIAFDALLRIRFAPTMPTFSTAFWTAIRYEFHDTLLTNAFLCGLGSALRTWAEEDRRNIAESEARAAVARTEMESLARGIPPRLIGEALRAIGALVARDTARARSLIVTLASVLRESFLRRGAAVVPLAAEVASTEQFVALQRNLGLSALALDITATADARDALVPPFLLQALVRESMAHDTARLSIRAEVEGDRLRAAVVATPRATPDSPFREFARLVELAGGTLHASSGGGEGSHVCEWSVPV